MKICVYVHSFIKPNSTRTFIPDRHLFMILIKWSHVVFKRKNMLSINNKNAHQHMKGMAWYSSFNVLLDIL